MTIIASGLELFFLFYVWWRFKLSDYGPIKQRMEAYSRLKGKLETEPHCELCHIKLKSEKCNSYELTPGAHEVLLGTLKKIESKNAILLTILLFSLSLFSGAVLSANLNEEGVKNMAYLVMALLILPLLCSFRGIRQIDQSDFPCKGISDQARDSKRLQSELMGDLISKERAFKFSEMATKVSVICLLLIVVVDGLFK